MKLQKDNFNTVTAFNSNGSCGRKNCPSCSCKWWLNKSNTKGNSAYNTRMGFK